MKRFITVAILLLLAIAAAIAQSADSLSPTEIQGRQLAAEILSETPVTNFTETGVVRIRNSEGITNIPVTFQTDVGSHGWRVVYETMAPSLKLIIWHQDGQPNRYQLVKPDSQKASSPEALTQSEIIAPFAGSDFWIADLGLEFFHWPEQKIIGHQTRRTRDCTELESDNPNPSAGGYSRVVTWVDNQTLGIIHAEAYDANGKLLKVFDPKSLKKVNGQWELQDIEIRNVQTHSRTWIRFDLNDHS